MEVRRSDLEGIIQLANICVGTSGAEMEALLTDLDITAWQDIIQYLRSLKMREEEQVLKLNISLSNGIRITLEGAGIIQEYCRDNKIAGKPFTALLKENIEGGKSVELTAYGARVKLKREVMLAPDDARITEAIANWDKLGKFFRQIQRYEFVAPKGIPIRFDLSVVRSNEGGKATRTFQEAQIVFQSSKFEAEVELITKEIAAEKAAQHIIRGFSWMLQGRQKSFVLVSIPNAERTRQSFARIFTQGGGNFRFPGPQPITLERKHIESQLVTTPGGYNVTDKADGLRCALFVNEAGRVFLIDMGGRVYGTGLEVDRKLAGCALDGEWIRQDRSHRHVCHYLAFDILAAPGGDTEPTKLPFMIYGLIIGSEMASKTRYAVMTQIVAALNNTATQTVKGVPANYNLQIGVKSFRAHDNKDDIFKIGAAATLEAAKNAKYNTDGLIFSPNKEALPLGKGTWNSQLKWKPAEDNTIDFLVIVEKDRDESGAPLANDFIGVKHREDSDQIVRHKTLRLFVGSNSRADTRNTDARTQILHRTTAAAAAETNKWHPVLFQPFTDDWDPLPNICYLPIEEETELIKTISTNEILQTDMIVEMNYVPQNAPGWRWRPMRIRQDKTERWHNNTPGSTMNADWVAKSIWNSIHNPVSEEAIKTGVVEPSVIQQTQPLLPPQQQLQSLPSRVKPPQQDKSIQSLLFSLIQQGSTVCDLSMGVHTSDIIRLWNDKPVAVALGLDTDEARVRNAYEQLLSLQSDAASVGYASGRTSGLILFAQADASRNLRTGEAGMGPDDGEVLRRALDGQFKEGADIVYFIDGLNAVARDASTMAGFIHNLSELIKPGGLFVGVIRDGEMLAKSQMPTYMTKRYTEDDAILSLPASEAGLGMEVDIHSVPGESIIEYLVSWPYLESQLGTCGLERLTGDECRALKLPDSTRLFKDTKGFIGGTPLSKLNRWFVLRRRTIVQPPAPPRGSVAPPSSELQIRTQILPPASSTLKPLTQQASVSVAVASTSIEPLASAPLDITDAPVVVEAPVTPVTPEAPPAVTPVAPAVAPVAPAVAPVTPAVAPAVATAVAPAVPLPVAPFIVNPATKTPDNRLGAELSDWPRYMSFTTQIEITDLWDPTIKYPNLEAAIASAVFQKSTDKPELGPTMFRVEGALHQKFANKRLTLTSPADIQKSEDYEIIEVKSLANASYKKTIGATWDKAAWEAQRDEIYKRYLKQRFDTDARFRKMIQSIQLQGGEILFANGKEPSYLGVGIKPDGTVAGGDNLLGKWMGELK